MIDIDIDFADRNTALKLFDHYKAIRIDQEQIKPHPSGIYVQNIPHDPITSYATIDYKSAEDRGYFKIDFLNVSVYQLVRDEHHLNQLINQEPIWELLEHDDFTKQLFHVSDYGTILQKMRPKTVEQLAMVLAMIRPSKRYLLNRPWNEIAKEIWIPPNNGEYYFKKSHAHSYAVLIVVQMNALVEQLGFHNLN